MTNENEKEYICLQLSPFYVRCDEDYHCHVYVRGQKELVEVTKELTDEEKNILIEDLIYAISELVKGEGSESE